MVFAAVVNRHLIYLVQPVMYIILLQITALLAVIILPVFIIRAKTRKNSKKSVTKYRIDTDTTYARYAINEDGFLEEINQDKFSRHRY